MGWWGHFGNYSLKELEWQYSVFFSFRSGPGAKVRDNLGLCLSLHMDVDVWLGARGAAGGLSQFILGAQERVCGGGEYSNEGKTQSQSTSSPLKL